METYKHRIFIKNSKIILILCREEYGDPNEMNLIAGNIDGGYDSYQDKDFTSDLHPPIWGLDGGGNVIEMGDSHYETIRKSLEPS
tara:strand:+ start:230 stop:484 length:255 start_codon:yes stop_codon:yes gene_type:complete